MVERILTVELGLDDRKTHARTRFVPRQVVPVPKGPMLGDPWCPLTVRARLQRLAEVFRKVPHTPDTKPQQIRSNMPEPVREIFKDQPAEPMTLPVGNADMTASKQVLDSLVTLSRLNRIVAWSLANEVGDRKLGRYIRRDRRTAATLKQKLLAFLASDWSARGWAPDAVDVSGAQEFIHKNLD